MGSCTPGFCHDARKRNLPATLAWNLNRTHKNPKWPNWTFCQKSTPSMVSLACIFCRHGPSLINVWFGAKVGLLLISSRAHISITRPVNDFDQQRCLAAFPVVRVSPTSGRNVLKPRTIRVCGFIGILAKVFVYIKWSLQERGWSQTLTRFGQKSAENS